MTALPGVVVTFTYPFINEKLQDIENSITKSAQILKTKDLAIGNFFDVNQP